MVKDQQVRRLVKLQKNEKTLTMAAAKAGLSRKTARKYLKSGKLPSQSQPERYWRTRSDPFESVWPEVEEILKRSPTVEATAVFEYLCRQQEGAFQQGQLRPLQRRTIDECPPRGEVVQRPTEAAQEPRGSGPLPSTPARARGSSVRATPSLHPPRILKTISLFYRKEDPEKSRLRGRLQLFFFIPRVGISNCRCGNSICR